MNVVELINFPVSSLLRVLEMMTECCQVIPMESFEQCDIISVIHSSVMAVGNLSICCYIYANT